jgi:hypothetical protein
MRENTKSIKNKLKAICFSIIGLLFLFSCQKDDENFDKGATTRNAKNYVSKEMAVNAATIFLQKYHASNSDVSRIADVSKTIMNVFTFKTESNDDAMYAINYEEGGFILVSSDNRVSPIRAFSEEGYFSNNIDEIPDPVVSWMEEEKESVKYVIDNQLTQKVQIKEEWDFVSNTTTTYATCSNGFFQKGPLMTTTWGQGIGYNNLIPVFCSNPSYGNRPPTGCVTTATAQVLKYHHKPNSIYDYSQMPNNYGSYQTQALMFNTGLALGISYNSCESSGTNTENISSVLMNIFGYSNVVYLTAYNTSLIFNQILVNKPVILRGGRRRDGITYPWNYYTGGHAWVADGCLFVVLQVPNGSGNCDSYGFNFLHMNWGWGDLGIDDIKNYNGWYNENNFNPGTSTYNYGRGTVYITP